MCLALGFSSLTNHKCMDYSGLKLSCAASRGRVPLENSRPYYLLTTHESNHVSTFYPDLTFRFLVTTEEEPWPQEQAKKRVSIFE